MRQKFTILLTHQDVVGILSTISVDVFMRELIDELQTAFQRFSTTEFDVPIRTGFHYETPHPGLIEWMPLHRHGQSVFIKTVGYHPTNPQVRMLPTVISTFSLFDPTSGCLLAVCDGAALTALRTGAASAIATRMLSDLSRPVSMGLIGCGAQAVTQLHALMQVATINEIRVFDIRREVSDSLGDRIASFNHGDVPVIVTSVDDVVQNSDVISTATSISVGDGPLFDDLTPRDHVHVNAVGSDLPGKIELPLSLLSRSHVCPDFPEQAIIEGECQQLTREQIGSSIMCIVANADAYSNLKQQRTVFDSTGWALEDYVATELLMRYARELHVGSRVALSGNTDAPYNPYEGIKSIVTTGAR
ncbi:ornithine cyclodeaminase family protein [Stieleria varia]|nr:ornithine cyclodeaminase family protein [Stieleria varia]